mgnify:CR=1 FL=1|jgi:hypothetical protein|nr:MAG TPA: Lower collar protein [Caudoviricetes sp.]
MAKYTALIAEECWNYLSDVLDKPISEIKLMKFDDICYQSRPLIFDFNYPIFDEEYRPVLETNFIKFFYTYEIGSETWRLFKDRLNADFAVKMPYYNELYKTQLMKFDPFTTVDITETNKGQRTANGNTSTDSKGHSSSGVDSNNVYSDTPQTLLNDLDYATNMTKNNVKNTADTTQEDKAQTESTTNDDFVTTRKGQNGYDNNILLARYRDNLINVDYLLFNDLLENFMMIY